MVGSLRFRSLARSLALSMFENLQMVWVEICCFGWCCLQKFWPKVVMRKWFNISDIESDFSADTEDDEDNDTDSDFEDLCGTTARALFYNQVRAENSDSLPKAKRRKSETFRAQYIHKKEIKVCVGTWNVGGVLPKEELNLDDWLGIKSPSDIYVLGFQEIVPLNAGNIFGAEDNHPVEEWERMIRETLNRVRHETPDYKSFSDPPSPSRFKAWDDAPYMEDEEETPMETDSDEVDEEVHPLNDGDVTERPWKKLDRLNCIRMENGVHGGYLLNKTLSGTERMGLSWPEPPLNLISRLPLQREKNSPPVTLKPSNLSKSVTVNLGFPRGRDPEKIRKSPFVRLVSKQMVGIFLTVWIRRNLRRHIQNARVSTVGVGVMGYIGNKGSVAASMSIYQTTFCFVCSHLSSGEKEGDELRRNADAHEIRRRTCFRSTPETGLPKHIHDHERIIWLGDLNYRVKLPYEKTQELIGAKDWSQLGEGDEVRGGCAVLFMNVGGLVEEQLVRELKKGRAFGGWREGELRFAPTYKYEYNSEKYAGEDPAQRVGRRTPAWCDRVLWQGKGIGLLSYRRTEIKLSDHRPVTATYLIDVEVFCPRRLQRALTLTDAEINPTFHGSSSIGS